jgi:hypothetical protein
MQRDICFGAGYLPLTNIPLRGILIANSLGGKKDTNTLKICKKYHCYQPIKIQRLKKKINPDLI